MMFKSGVLKRALLFGGLTLAAVTMALAPTPAAARAFVSVAIGLPWGPAYVAPPPVVYAPPPVAYAPPPPVVYAPPAAYAVPGYYYGAPMVGGVGVVWGHGYRYWH